MKTAFSVIPLGPRIEYSLTTIEQAFQELWQDTTAIFSMLTEDGDSKIGVSIGSIQVYIGLSDGPFPCHGRLIGSDGTDADALVHNHARHFYISAMSFEGDALFALISALTQVTAATVQACQASLGVYWPASGTIVPRNEYLSVAKKGLRSVRRIWAQITTQQSQLGVTSGETYGLHSLGFLDLVVTTSPETELELGARLRKAVDEIIDGRLVLREGITIGCWNGEPITTTLDAEFMSQHKITRMIVEYGPIAQRTLARTARTPPLPPMPGKQAIYISCVFVFGMILVIFTCLWMFSVAQWNHHRVYPATLIVCVLPGILLMGTSVIQGLRRTLSSVPTRIQITILILSVVGIPLAVWGWRLCRETPPTDSPATQP